MRADIHIPTILLPVLLWSQFDVQDDDARMVAGRIHALKRDVLGKERMEMKGSRLITRPTFRRRPMEVAFVEEFFNTLLNLPCHDLRGNNGETNHSAGCNLSNLLPNQYRFLTQRVQLLAEAKDEMAVMLIDGSPSQVGGLSFKFESFLISFRRGPRVFQHRGSALFRGLTCLGGSSDCGHGGVSSSPLPRSSTLQECPLRRRVSSCNTSFLPRYARAGALWDLTSE